MFNAKPSINKHEKNLERAGAFVDIKKINKIKGRLTFLAVAGAFIGLIGFFPLHVLIFGGVGFGERLSLVGSFFLDFATAVSSGNKAYLAAWFSNYWGWYFSSVAASLTNPHGLTPIAPWKAVAIFFPWIASVMVPAMMIKPMTEGLNDTPNIFGDTRWAEERDVDAMSARDLVGFDGKLFLVGKIANKMIRMKETLSVLLLAPPGTGKTAAFIVPSTVIMDKSCQMLNDQKPELFHMTSGHRSTLGPVFQIMWSATDMPEGGYVTEEQARLLSPDLIDTDPAGNPITDESGAIKVKPVFYPSWNPLGPSSMPSPGPKRDLYIERLVNVLCPDPQGGGDKFWTSQARSALIGLIHFLVTKVEMGQDPLYPTCTLEGIPLLWRDKEASFPMFVDWFTEAQNASEDSEGDDPMRSLFRNALAEAKVMDEAYVARNGMSIMNRSKAALTQLMNQPDKTRGSILTTLDEALNPFKNEAVRQRTSSSSFSFTELRGSPKPEARAREVAKAEAARKEGKVHYARYKKDEWDPITIYISINAEDAKAFATITGIFVDSANSYLVANGPNSVDDRNNLLGPFDFFFLLDETPTLPKLDTVINGPAVGRSKRVSYAIVGQDFAQIETRYSKPEVETMKSTTAIKVILSQNNESAAKTISAMAGSMTYKKASYGMKQNEDPVSKFLNLKKEIITSENWEKRDFIDSSFVMSMPVGKHIVLVQNFMNRPILADSTRFFEEPEISRRVFNLRSGTGPKPSLPMPRHLMDLAAVAGRKAADIRQKEVNIQEALKEPEVAIVVSPANVAALSYDFDTQQPSVAPGILFAAARVKLTEEDSCLTPPAQESIAVISSADEMEAIVTGRKVYVFEEADFQAMNKLLSDAGKDPIPGDLMVAIKSEALENEKDMDDGDFFTIGYYGNARTDRPGGPVAQEPEFAFSWMCEILNVVHGCEFEYKRIKLEE